MTHPSIFLWHYTQKLAIVSRQNCTLSIHIRLRHILKSFSDIQALCAGAMVSRQHGTLFLNETLTNHHLICMSFFDRQHGTAFINGTPINLHLIICWGYLRLTARHWLSQWNTNNSSSVNGIPTILHRTSMNFLSEEIMTLPSRMTHPWIFSCMQKLSSAECTAPSS